MALPGKQQRFVDEYIIDLNGSAAYLRAGYKSKNPDVDCQKLLVKSSIQEAIQLAIKKRSERTEITADKVLQRWWDIATANPNDIIHLRRVCCRQCFGIDHQFQWVDEAEYQRAVQSAINTAEEMGKHLLIPSDAGGYGFNRLLRPHPKCPNCSGEGIAETHIEDTRHLSPKAKLLYAGIKQTQAGIEIKFKDQDKALENVAKHLGMFIDKKEITGPNGGPIEIESPEQRQKRIEALLKKRDG